MDRREERRTWWFGCLYERCNRNLSVWVYGLGEFQGVRVRYQLYSPPHQVDKDRKGSN